MWRCFDRLLPKNELIVIVWLTIGGIFGLYYMKVLNNGDESIWIQHFVLVSHSISSLYGSSIILRPCAFTCIGSITILDINMNKGSLERIITWWMTCCKPARRYSSTFNHSYSSHCHHLIFGIASKAIPHVVFQLIAVAFNCRFIKICINWSSCIRQWNEIVAWI